MRIRFLTGWVILFLSLAPACSFVQQKERDKEEIKAALTKYLNERSGLNLSAMTWEIKEFNQDRDRATVQLLFTSKQGGVQMPVTYELRKENNVWTVQRPSGSATPHGAAVPPMPQMPSAGELPSGHPPVGGEAPPPKAPEPQRTTPRKTQ